MPAVTLAISLGNSRTGLAVTAKVRAIGSASIVAVTAAEVTAGSYEGTFASPAVAAVYAVEFVDGSGKQVGAGSFATDAAGNEITLAPVAAKLALLAVDEQGRVTTANPATGPTVINQEIDEGTWEVNG